MKTIALFFVLAVAACGQTWVEAMEFIPHSLYGWRGSVDTAIDGTVTRRAFCGTYTNATYSAKSIRKIHGASGAITKTGGSGITFFLSDPDTSAGPPMQPDGTEDQTVDMNNASIPLPNTNYVTGNLSADRSVTPGDTLCVGYRWDNAGRQVSDSLQMMLHTTVEHGGIWGIMAASLTYAGSWSATTGTNFPLIFFEHSDGTYGWLNRARLFFNPTSTTISNSTAVREQGNIVQVSQPKRITAIAYTNATSAGASEAIIYDSSNTALRTVVIPANWATNNTWAYLPIEPLDLAANTVYRVVRKPTTSTAITAFAVSYANTALMDLDGGSAIHLTQRDSAGTWTETTTQRAQIILVSSHTQVTGGSSASSYPIQ